MRVLHLNSSLLHGGGSENIIVNLITENKEVKSFISIINNSWSDNHLQKLNKDFILLFNRKEGSKNIIESVKIIYNLSKYIKEKKIDVVHCHNSFSLKLAYILKKMTKVKVVFTVHSTNVFNKSLKNYPIDKYVAISKSVYNTIKSYVPEYKVELIYNGVKLENFYNQSKPKRETENVNISCVARIVPEIKGQDILLKALGLLKNKYNFPHFKCFFAGAASNEEDLMTLKKIVKENALENNVVFLGNVENIQELYSNTDIFVLPSRYEGFGLSVIEALAAGCKVIVSKLEGPLEIIKENEQYGLHFNKENDEELAFKIFHLINNFDYKKSYKDENVISYLESNYSLNKMLHRYNNVYKSLCTR